MAVEKKKVNCFIGYQQAAWIFHLKNITSPSCLFCPLCRSWLQQVCFVCLFLKSELIKTWFYLEKVKKSSYEPPHQQSWPEDKQPVGIVMSLTDTTNSNLMNSDSFWTS